MEVIGIVLLVAVVYLAVRTRELGNRITKLENYLTREHEARLEENRQTDGVSEAAGDAPAVTPDALDPNTPAPDPAVPAPLSRGNRVRKLSAQPAAPTAAVSETPPSRSPETYVFRRETIAAFTTWIAKNWFYALAAVSLGLSGLFLIQYGVENGLLTPPWRVISGIALGFALIIGGEYIRRRGDDETGSLAYLPSTLASGGFVTMFGAIVGAHRLYGLIGAELCFALLALIGIAALLLGWLYGPLLAAVGTIGALAAPFMIGGSSAQAHMLMPYFVLIAAVSLGVDSLKRWAWLSTLAATGAIAAISLVFLATRHDLYFVGSVFTVFLLAVVIPTRSIAPVHAGPALIPSLWRALVRTPDKVWPDFPPRLVWGALIAASGAPILILDPSPDSFWFALVALGCLLALTLVWFRTAEGLEDTPLVPLAAFGGLLALSSPVYNPLGWRAVASETDQTLVLVAAQPVLALLGLATVLSALAGWRSFGPTRFPVAWSIAAVAVAPLTAVGLELLWSPTQSMSPYTWALALLTVAALMTFLTNRYASSDTTQRLRMALAMGAAIVMIAFAVVTVLSETALTVALALTTALTALLGVRFRLPQLGALVALGAIVVSARLIVIPGLFWAMYAPWWEFLFVFVAGIGCLYAAKVLWRGGDAATTAVLHSAIWSLGGIGTCIAIARYIDDGSRDPDIVDMALFAIVWLVLAFVQLYRRQTGGKLATVRLVLGSIYLLVAVLPLALLYTLLNPLLGFVSQPVVGVPVLNSLLFAYGVPAAVLLAMGRMLHPLRRWVRIAFFTMGGAMAAFTAALLIRHSWRGSDMELGAMSDGELYSYTVVMMIASGILLLLAFSKKDDRLRKVALAAMGITAAKVFLVDASGLTGLIRVVAFLGLGLTLAGLAWLNRTFLIANSGSAIPNDQPVEENDP